PTTLARVHRLRDPQSPRWVSAAAYTGAAAILVVPTLAVAIPWLTELSRLFATA
ncbi:MAG: M56 family peptidase, partial [Gordonia amarae]